MWKPHAVAAFAARHGTALASLGAAAFLATLMLIPQPPGAEGGTPRAFLWECHTTGSEGGQLAATLLAGGEAARTIAPLARSDEERPTRGLAFGAFARE
ncbi:MAG: hypothetical protein HS107_14035 [Thermoflexaceae bacterium]|nr:hypothetical protein [Thermoflexaceae bacterium]